MKYPILILLFLLARGLPVSGGEVIYGVVPTLFGSDRPLLSVVPKLESIRSLGATMIWLTPLQATDDPSHISYAATNHAALRSDFGPPEDLKKLVEEAHRLGLRVLVDFVPSHSSSGHPWYKAAPGEKAYNYYLRDAEGKALYDFDWENLPKLNYDNPELVDEMVRAMRWWIETFGVDGFRMDAAWSIQRRSPEAWKTIVQRVREGHPNIFILAEADADESWVFESGFDAGYDWADEPGHWAWETVFSNPEAEAHRLPELLNTPAAGKTLRALNTNDSGERFLKRHGPEVARLATVLVWTAPGIPLVYTGDETDENFDPYDDPPPLTWTDPHGMRDHLRKLSALRSSQEALRSGSVHPLASSPGVAAFTRRSGTEEILVVLNFGDLTEWELPAEFRHADFTLLWGEEAWIQGGKIRLPAKEALVLRLGPKAK